jgi:hypothetical protein
MGEVNLARGGRLRGLGGGRGRLRGRRLRRPSRMLWGGLLLAWRGERSAGVVQVSEGIAVLEADADFAARLEHNLPVCFGIRQARDRRPAYRVHQRWK